tara:strand:+ start:472 stop:780 length:309 start_codon:yes stop_codon:yes gene_type:complete
MGFSILIPLGLVVVIVLLFIIFRVNDDSIDNFMGKVYKSAYDANKKDAIKKLKKKDSELAKDLDIIDDMRKKHFKKLDKMSPEKREKRLQKAKNIVSSFDKD